MWKRNCPSCEKEIIYKRERNYNKAIKNNTLCLSCALIGKMSGEKNPMYGKKRPDVRKRLLENNPSKNAEIKKLLSEQKIGIRNPQYGKKGINSIRYGINHTEETIKIIREKGIKRFKNIKERERLSKKLSGRKLSDSYIIHAKEGWIKSVLGISIEEYENAQSDWQKYKKEVKLITNQQPLNLLENYNKRGNKNYHVDHIIPIAVGFKNGISAKIIGNIKNLRMLPYRENLMRKRNININKFNILLHEIEEQK